MRSPAWPGCRPGDAEFRTPGLHIQRLDPLARTVEETGAVTGVSPEERHQQRPKDADPEQASQARHARAVRHAVVLIG